MAHRLSSLLPCQGSSNLRGTSERIQILKLINTYCNHLLHAKQAFTLKKFRAFDAQVSDNLCQIRAYQLTILNQKNKKILFQTTTILSIQNNVTHLLHKYKNILKNRNSTQHNQAINTLQFLLEKKLEMYLTETEYFLLQTFILSEYKITQQYRMSPGIDYKKFCSLFFITSKTFAKKIVHRLQRNIAELSCRFIFKLAADSGYNAYELQLLKDLYKQDEVGRQLISCYEVTRIIFRHAKQNNPAFLLVLFNEDLPDKPITQPLPQHNNPSYWTVFYATTQANLYSNEGKKDFFKKLSCHSTEELILANMAQHPQYPGLLLTEEKFNPYQNLAVKTKNPAYLSHIRSREQEFLKAKYLAKTIGCSSDNPSLVFIRHIFYDSGLYYAVNAQEEVNS